VLTDPELDARLAGAAGFRDADLPPLPVDLAALIGQPTPAAEPASLIAARQLVDDARASRTPARPRRRPRRALLLRAGAAAVAVAAVWAAVVLPADTTVPPDVGTAAPTPVAPGVPDTVPPTPAPPTIALPTGGISLVAAEAVTFPFSVDPAPAGLTQLLSRSGGVEAQGSGPLTYTADYLSLDATSGDQLIVELLTTHPRDSVTLPWPQETPDPGDSDDHSISDTGQIVIAGQDAEYLQATEASGDDVAHLTWQRPDGQWVHVLGHGAYGRVPALVTAAESVVFRPQPMDLQFGLAPAGWSVTGFETGDPAAGGSLDLTSDRDPAQLLRLSLIGRQGGATIDNALEDIVPAASAEPVTVHGLDARLTRVPASDGQPEHWVLVGQFVADGPLLVLLAPVELTQEQVVAIADQTSYTP
jgi:hypothetical protein